MTTPAFKYFFNNTGWNLSVALVVREGGDPRHQVAGEKTFSLDPKSGAWQSYGNGQTPFLNGIRVSAFKNGGLVSLQEFVIVRGSEIDNQLNMYNAVTFEPANGQMTIVTSQRNEGT
ncbi:hypothetical protein ACQ86G_26040 [Roseateles chitinivorans]|uniref:hypothetical protein n=1 Tax=Roseateles chitinivorans TaxID=2917965 RepID=UPI003D667F82